MPTIRKLPASVVNKIAAGEVIERPASVVKELVENALDAGAGRIDVTVEQGGMALIRVSDDGCGIPPEELELAVASHATSKLATEEDLFRVRTLGFRGEALASIAEVSHLVLRSRPAAAAVGAELAVTGGQLGRPVPCGGPPGTTVEVRNLFFNTPVRRKFLRSTQTEMGHVAEAFCRLALGACDRHFSLTHNRRLLYDLPPVCDLKQRIAALFGEEVVRDLIAVESRDEQVRLWGYVGHPNQTRANNRMQYLFLNGRHIRDRSLQHALAEAYRGLITTGRYPISFLTFEMPPELVDVNVHPTKLEVRFQDGGRLYSQLLGTLRTRFLKADLTHRLEPAASVAGGRPGATPHPAADELRAELVAWAKGQLAPPLQAVPGPTVSQPLQAAHTVSPPPPASGTPLRLVPVAPAPSPALPAPSLPSEQVQGGDRPTRAAEGTAEAVAVAAAERRVIAELGMSFGQSERAQCPSSGGPLAYPDQRPLPAASDASPQPSPAWPDEAAGRAEEESIAGPRPSTAPQRLPLTSATGTAGRVAALQVHNRYLVAESEEGVVVIDQHALHERILYEQLRASLAGGTLESQRLLIPEPVDLTPAEASGVLESAELLARLGLEVEPFGGDTVLVHSVPALLSGAHPGELLRSLAELLLSRDRPPEGRDLLDGLLHQLACKAAVKAGDPLHPEEIAALLAQRHLAADAHHCPHGRPTALVLTRQELDRQFRRT
jgi:DNA mismatch repair protein MutL